MREVNHHSRQAVKESINLGLEELIDAAPVAEAKDLADLFNQLKSLAAQLENRSLPRALIAEQLLGLKSQLAGIAESEESVALFMQLRKSLLAKDAPFSLNHETSQKLLAEDEIKLKSKTAEPRTAALTQAVTEPVSDMAQFSSLVRSIDEKRKSALAETITPACVAYSRSRVSKTSLIAICITLLFTVSFIIFRFSREPEMRLAFLPTPQAEELTKLQDKTLSLPSFDPIHDIGSLSSLAYELGSKQALPATERTLVLNAATSNSHTKRPEQLQIGAQDEPAQIREMQVKPEEKLPENEIDFPPFRTNKSTPSQNAPTRPVDGHAVDRFSIAKPYIAVVPTDIMPRPSYYGQSVGALRSGQQILVDALIGPWVRIRLADGRPGFVLAQDVSATTL